MNMLYTLRFELLSDTTFGRGDGVAGWVDQEVEHDADGLPFLHGRTLKGLLREEGVNILFALQRTTGRAVERNGQWIEAAERLFGEPGSTAAAQASVAYGDACLPAAIRAAVYYELAERRPKRNPALQPADVLESLTAVRRQTAMDEMGVPEKASLRAMRVVLRKTVFEADIVFGQPPGATDLAFLAACVKALRHAGSGRNRGRGKLISTLHDETGKDVTDQHLAAFEAEVGA